MVCAIFIDFKQAFDSLDRGTLWAILRAYGVHPHLVSLLEAYYQGGSSTVRANGSTSAPFSPAAGVRQGCPLSPLLFNVFMDFVLRCYLSKCDARGIPGVRFSFKLPDGTVGSRHLRHMSYADDLTLTPPSLGVALASLGVLEEVCDEWGLAINWDKSEMVVFAPGSDPPDYPVPQSLPMGRGRHLKVVP